MINALLTVLVAAAPMASLPADQPQPLRGIERITDHRPQPRGDMLFRNAMLAMHNRTRADYGVAALSWNKRLAADAAEYARHMALTGRFAHDSQAGRKQRQGENLWMGTRNAFRYEKMVSLMVDERAQYRPGIFPDVSRTGRWWEVAHYTQLIWPTTKQVGCSLASNRSDDFLVCRYSPAGNVVGAVLR